jgi:hypothetical protein
LLHLAKASASDVYARFQNSNNGTFLVGVQGSSGDVLIFTSAAKPIRFGTNDTEQMRLDSSGNLGLGVTPSAWSNGYKALQIGQSSFSSVGNAVYLWQNIYQDSGGTNRYISTGTAGLTGWEGNTYKWYQAPSGTAGTAVSVTQPMALDASGNLLVGTTSLVDSSRLNVLRTNSGSVIGAQVGVNGNYVLAAVNASGSVVGGVIANASTTSFPTSSDYRLKENIQPMTGALAKVAALKPCTYKWKVEGSHGQGFIAHELQEVVPECVVGEKDAVDADGNPKYQGIDTSFLVATLTAAIQELKAEFDAYKASHP